MIIISFIADKQPETPRPESLQPLLSEKVAILPNLGRRHSSSPSRSPSFTTSTFHSNSYATGGPMRRRRAESIFSFETGPNFSNTRQFHDLINMDQTNR
jgi:hypothetical protein